jgi:hypothetical protein
MESVTIAPAKKAVNCMLIGVRLPFVGGLFFLLWWVEVQGPRGGKSAFYNFRIL